jgi:uncharacterized protein with GYD domain
MESSAAAHAQHYVLLVSWTDEAPTIAELAQGDPPTPKDRELKIKAGLQAVRGGELIALYWTLGPYDMVALVKADSAVDVAGLSLALGQQALRTITMPAFDPESASDVFERAKLCGRAMGMDFDVA